MVKFSNAINILLYYGNYYEVLQFYPYLNRETYKTWTTNKIALANALLSQRKVISYYNEFNSEFANYLIEHDRYLIYEIDCYLASHRAAKTFLKMIKYLKELEKADNSLGACCLIFKKLEIRLSKKLCNAKIINKIFEELPDSCNKADAFQIDPEESYLSDRKLDLFYNNFVTQMQVNFSSLNFISRMSLVKRLKMALNLKTKRLNYDWVRTSYEFLAVNNLLLVEELEITHKEFFTMIQDGLFDPEITFQSIKKLILTPSFLLQKSDMTLFSSFDQIKDKNLSSKASLKNLKHVVFRNFIWRPELRVDFNKYALAENQSVQYCRDKDDTCSCSNNGAGVIAIKAHDIYIYTLYETDIKMFKVKEFSCRNFEREMKMQTFFFKKYFKYPDKHYLTLPALRCSNFIEISEVQIFPINVVENYCLSPNSTNENQPFLNKIRKDSSFLHHLKLMKDAPDTIIIENKNIDYVCTDNYSKGPISGKMVFHDQFKSDWVLNNCNLYDCKTVDLCFNESYDQEEFERVAKNLKICHPCFDLNIHIYTYWPRVTKIEYLQLKEILSIKPPNVYLSECPGLYPLIISLLCSIPVKSLTGTNLAIKHRIPKPIKRKILQAENNLYMSQERSQSSKNDFIEQLEIRWM
ncbi:unnamed protein product [Moneuplotes crassus]|uniref:Uncharacterized protein n=1 Tax=Euplotes crassus TaxID=5936 RepID=A0AAD1X452_EUPCR|nr:unnamed protein product [Moneuplotes crassus]